MSHYGVCLENEFRRTLSSGVHVLHLTNREEGTHSPTLGIFGDVTAVTRVVITNDPVYSP